jgi:hypothetical protein
MLMTPTEARAMWCCQARGSAVYQVKQHTVIPCLPGACMAWQWVGELTARPGDKARGYCGLAGKPEGVV